MFNSREGGDHDCGDCIGEDPHFRRARAVFLYRETVSELIRRFKYNGKLQLAAPLGAVLRLGFERYWAEGRIDLMIPIPLHPRRLRQRGFNQSYLLLRSLMRPAAAPCAGATTASIATEILIRVKSTTPQAGLNRGDRARNIENAFEVRRPDRVRSKRILLVDDIFTTGATVDECARVLLNNGAETVDVLTLARAP
jgi:ComF family protein